MAAEPSVPDDSVERSEIDALLETRRELGPEYDRALVDSFAARVEAAIDARKSSQSESSKHLAKREEAIAKRRWILGIVSIGVGLPVTAVAGALTGIAGVVVVWVGIVLVNLAHAIDRRRT